MESGENPPLGVWSTDRECYLLLADSVAVGGRTLETGSGLSTVLLTAAGARHTCVTPSTEEADRLLAYCASRNIDTTLLTFEIGGSDEVLPRLPQEAMDLVLIDGSHGFPTPMLDWYYAGSLLRRDGLLVIDDVQLPAVAELCRFIDGDPRWACTRRTEKWIAYRRASEGSLRQDWFLQPFYAAATRRGMKELPARAWRKLRRTVTGRK
jgi:predicted O-methyltransferase YrrM